MELFFKSKNGFRCKTDQFWSCATWNRWKCVAWNRRPWFCAPRRRKRWKFWRHLPTRNLATEFSCLVTRVGFSFDFSFWTGFNVSRKQGRPMLSWIRKRKRGKRCNRICWSTMLVRRRSRAQLGKLPTKRARSCRPVCAKLR